MTTLINRLNRFRSELQSKWTHFTSTDLDEVTSDITRLKEKLKSHYKLSEEEANAESQRFTDAFDATYSLQDDGKWKEGGAPQTQEQDHPEREMIRKDKDNGRYGTADDAGDLH